MRFYEIQNIKPKKPLTPAQARIDALKRNAEIIKRALASERKAQQITKSHDEIRKISAPRNVT